MELIQLSAMENKDCILKCSQSLIDQVIEAIDSRTLVCIHIHNIAVVC